MQIKRRRPIKKNIQQKRRVNINSLIHAPSVYLIDENNKSLGEIKTVEALEFAKKAELDLVEVNPKSNPPVCKIMDFGKFKYEQEKMIHKQKVASKKSEIKGIRLSFKIKGGDLENRIKLAKRFLDNDNQVKIELILKGRERAYSYNAIKILDNFIKDLGDVKIIQSIQKQGGKIFAIVTSK